MQNIFVELLPPWVETGLQPAFYDKESGTVLQQTARMYAKVNQVVETVNHQNEVIDEYVEKFNELHDYVYNYFDNLDVQEEINNKLDAMAEDGTLGSYFARFVNPRLLAMDNQIQNINDKVSSLIGITPIVVTSTDDMVDTSKVYVLTSDGHWYYYANNQWNDGGSYLSDAGESLIQSYISITTETTNNPVNPIKCLDNTALATATGASSSNNSYWITDYIPVQANSDYETDDRVCFGSISNSKVVAKFPYKICYYASDKTFIHTEQNYNYALYVDKSVENYENIAYARFQYAKSVIPFSDAKYTTYSADQLSTNTRYLAEDLMSLKNIDVSNLEDGLADVTFYNLCLQNKSPFTRGTLVAGTMTTADGKRQWAGKRLTTGKFYSIPSGTLIELPAGWTGIALAKKNGIYLGRYVNWSNKIYINQDLEVAFVFQYGDTNIDLAKLESLVSGITVTHSESPVEYYGEKVDIKNYYTTSNTNFSGLGQDGDSYNDIIIFLNSLGQYKVYSTAGEVLKDTSYIDDYSNICPHANMVNFGSEKYDADDNYPLVYTNAYNAPDLPRATLYAYRLTNDYSTMSLQQTIKVGFADSDLWTGGGSNVRPYGNFAVDNENGMLYAFTMIDSLQVTRFFKFKMPTLSDGSTVTLTTDDLIEYFDCPYEKYIQGCVFHNNKIYSLSGFGTGVNPALMHVIDVVSKKEVSTLPLGSIEPEFVFVNNYELYFGQSQCKKMNF